tara:strand:- start:1325 stop:2023 length:699 start_codon:yes stop_codon:yes gene_type:complete
MILNFYKGETIPEIIISNLKKKFKSSQIVIATSTTLNDKIFEEIAKKTEVNCFRGPENDVLSRFIQCANFYNANTIVRICADNPFIQEDYIEPLLKELNHRNLDYVSYKMKDGTPVMLSHIGLFAEVMKLKFLKKIYSMTREHYYREHVTNYLYYNKDSFKHKFLKVPNFLYQARKIRLTVDTKEDFSLAQEIYEKIKMKTQDYHLEDLIELIDENPVLKLRMKAQIKENAK